MNIINPKDFPIGFINQSGYDCPKIADVPYCFGLLAPKAIYQFTLHDKFPLTLHYTDGMYYRPNKKFRTDQGSVPRLAQLLIPKDRFLLSFLFHDSGYIEGGLWVCGTYDGEYKFMALHRSEIDAMLRTMIRLEPSPGGLVSSSSVWIGVRLVGGLYWNSPKVRPSESTPCKDQPTACPKSAYILHN